MVRKEGKEGRKRKKHEKTLRKESFLAASVSNTYVFSFFFFFWFSEAIDGEELASCEIKQALDSYNSGPIPAGGVQCSTLNVLVSDRVSQISTYYLSDCRVG